MKNTILEFIADEGHAPLPRGGSMGKLGLALFIANEIRGVLVAAPIAYKLFF